MNEQTDPSAVSPVKDISPNSLDELFSRDPLELADADIDKIVAVLRERRNNWLIAEEAPKTKRAPAKKLTQDEVNDLLKDLPI